MNCPNCDSLIDFSMAVNLDCYRGWKCKSCNCRTLLIFPEALQRAEEPATFEDALLRQREEDFVRGLDRIFSTPTHGRNKLCTVEQS